jgi:hypothetical protein
MVQASAQLVLASSRRIFRLASPIGLPGIRGSGCFFPLPLLELPFWIIENVRLLTPLQKVYLNRLAEQGALEQGSQGTYDQFQI